MTSGSTLSTAQIATKAKSNLAMALACLPKERKRDMISFYAFCRVVDDIAESPTLNEEEKERELAQWKKCVLSGEAPGHSVLDEVIELPGKYGFPRAWLAEIIDGVASDITTLRYETFEDLRAYCYKVASVVGLLTLSGCQLCLLPCYLCAGSTSGATLASAPLPPAPSPEH
jgi:phytoene synthase